MGCAQIDQLPTFVEAKRTLALRYKRWFDQFDIQFILEPSGTHSNYWLNAVLFENLEVRDNFLKYTNDHGVMTRPMWTLMNKLSIFQGSQCGELSNAEWLEQRIVNIPSSMIIT